MRFFTLAFSHSSGRDDGCEGEGKKVHTWQFEMIVSNPVLLTLIFISGRISQLEDTLRSKSTAEEALERQKQACDLSCDLMIVYESCDLSCDLMYIVYESCDMC